MPNVLGASLLFRDFTPIGLDVGHNAIKMLQLRRVGPRSSGDAGWAAGRSSWQVSAQASYLFAQDARQDPSLRWQWLVPAVQSMLNNRSGGRFRGRQVVAALDHEQVQIKNARLPRMPADELCQAVRWEAAERFPFDVSAGLVRHLLAGEVRQGGEHRQEVLMFAVSDQTLRLCLGQLQKAGVQPVGLDSRPVALVRAMELFSPETLEDAGPASPDGLPTPAEPPVQVLADLGSRSCSLVITRARRIVFIKNIDVGTDDVNRAVAEKIGTGLEDTASLRRRLGRAHAEPPDPSVGGPSAADAKVRRAVIAATRPVIERLAHEITLCLRYTSVTFRGSRPDRMTLVGGGSHDRLLVQLAEEALGMQVEVGWPLVGCLPQPPEPASEGEEEVGGGEWAVALGCCLKPAVSLKRRRTEASTVPSGSGEPRPARSAGPREPAGEGVTAEV